MEKVVYHIARREVGLYLRPDDYRVNYSVVRFGGDAKAVVRDKHLRQINSISELKEML